MGLSIDGMVWSICEILLTYAGINFIQNHPPPQGHDLKGAKTIPLDNHCVQKPSPWDKPRSQKPHPRDMKLEISQMYLKSVQSALSDLKRPPKRLQSQCNYRPFIT